MSLSETAVGSRQPILVAGGWRTSQAQGEFQAFDPTAGRALDACYPISGWEDCELAVESAWAAFTQLRQTPPDRIAAFLDRYATAIEQAAPKLCELAHRETGLPLSPRLSEVELPRTVGQLRMAAEAARTGSWALPTIDTKAGIRSCYRPIGPVCVFGPNNFPFAFGSVSGGDFAAAIAAGNPVIGKANSSHPGTTQKFAELALEAVKQVGLPEATVQLIYRTDHAVGQRLVGHPKVGATGYTGSRRAGLVLKAAADRAGKPIYLELSSVNPVVILPGALEQRGDELAEQFVGSALMGAGQFCTNPGLVLLVDGPASERFVEAVKQAYSRAPAGTLLSCAVRDSLLGGVAALVEAGAELLVGGESLPGERVAVSNSLLRVSGGRFLEAHEALQTEAFGNASLLVMASDIDQLANIIACLEGSLTGTIYSHTAEVDEAAYQRVAADLEQRVGRLLNDKMPTGVAVSPAMNHGGPYPATGHPGFTAVGIPASMLRFAKLTCYDAVRPERLPWLLQEGPATGSTWRCIDGRWSCH
jgi:alpha-ketoglutaric semialdehyde dehydrogenase